jgi:hypothetical protein
MIPPPLQAERAACLDRCATGASSFVKEIAAVDISQL